VALAAGLVLLTVARGAHTRAITAIYVVTLAGMFGVSATLNRHDWEPRAFGWLRRADHAMIFAFIAGTYTPLCVLGLADHSGARLLTLAWIAAGLGILRAALWPHAPRAITAGLFVAVGWVVVAYLPEAQAGLDPVTFWLLVVGGFWFTLGAMIYLFRWPDPWPRVFGFHEVFHVLVIIGCACHFAAVTRVVMLR